jgi:hypothetical protein
LKAKECSPFFLYWFGLAGYKKFATKKMLDMGSDLTLKIISIFVVGREAIFKVAAVPYRFVINFCLIVCTFAGEFLSFFSTRRVFFLYLVQRIH